MPGRAKQSVDQSISQIQNTVNTLLQTVSSAEKEKNKNKLQQAIQSLNSAKEQLSNFQD